jgi:hypothetical protein
VVLDDELIERAASALHDRSGGDAGDRAAYPELAEDEREKSRDGVRAIPELLAAVGYELVSITDADASTLSAEDRERASVFEHDRWAAFTRSIGYRYGPVRDDVLLHHPDLVPWGELDEATRDKDRVRIQAIEEVLPQLGLGLRRTRT